MTDAKRFIGVKSVILYMNCPILKEKSIFLEDLSRKLGKEVALCITDKGEEKVIIGEKNRVVLPSDCKIVVHTHFHSLQPSTADLRASHKATICILHKGQLACFEHGRQICLCEDCFEVSTAEYNLKQIAKNLLLIQDHLLKEACADCVAKHYLLCEAYAEEALSLDNAEKYKDLIMKVLALTNKHLALVTKFLKEGKHEENLQEMAQEVRQLRKEIVKEVYGIDEFWGDDNGRDFDSSGGS